MTKLRRVKVEGFKSIRQADVTLRDINVMIGANGAGKSNLVALFRMLRAAGTGELETYVARAGFASSLLHYGPSVTQEIAVELEFSIGSYGASFTYAAGDILVFADETKVRAEGLAFTEGWRVYHFHDTSDTSAVRQSHFIEDNAYLLPDAGNLSAYLYMLRETRRAYYDRIVSTIRQVAPFFGDFDLRPRELDSTQIMLNWRERGRDTLFGPHQFSDGTLRLMALVTLLLQPEDKLPSLLIIDEPELGLHPYAIEVVGDLIAGVSQHCQVLVSTQSAALLDTCDPEDVIVVDREGGETTFRHLDANALEAWREEYTLSELWDKNVLGGRPSR